MQLNPKLFVIVFVIALIVLGAAWIHPAIRDMARRHQVSQIIAGAQQVRPEISYRAEERKSLAGTGRGLVIKPDGPLTGGEVSEDGVIILRGSVDGYPVEVGLKPYLRDGKVQWRCRGLKVVEGWFIPASGYFSQSCPKASALDPL